MTTLSPKQPATKITGRLRRDWQMAMVVIRREVRDSFRDWRIIIPIILLTIFFPALMNFTARQLLGFVENYGASIIAEQLVPFLLLVVGFFPMSFSLIIALEVFVGERERKSLEPLLATPLTDFQLYIGKMVAALVPPLLASYLGMGVYLVGLYVGVGWTPTPQLLAQTVLISTIQGIIMVAGAVIISSQTTSVRAANLLASFIIVPMALLIQAEAAALFWGNHVGLWWLIAALGITALVLMRMGIQIFNREQLMGNEIDQIKLGSIWRQFWGEFSGKAENGRYPSPRIWYRQTLAILPQLRQPAVMLLIAFVGVIVLGVVMANTYQFPADAQAELTGERMMSNVAEVQGYANGLPTFIFVHNLRVIALQALLGIFTLGVLGILVFILPWGIIGYIAAQFTMAGESAFSFLLATIIPHALIELPALLLVGAALLRWHATVISPPPDRTLSEAFLSRMADFVRIFVGLVIPLLLVASLVEGFVTPQILGLVYGG